MEQDLEILMQVLDGNRDGVIDFDEFLVAIRGNLNERRKDLVWWGGSLCCDVVLLCCIVHCCLCDV